MVVQQFQPGEVVRIDNADLSLIPRKEQGHLAKVVGYDPFHPDHVGILRMLTGNNPGHQWYFRSGLTPMGGPW